MTKPTTAPEAWLDILHRSRFPDHPVGCDCTDAWMDRAEALELERLASEAGWVLSHSVSLPESVPAGEPATAAAEIDNLSERHWDVYETLVYYGPRTDEELVELYEARGWQRTTPQSPQSIRSRRAELVRAGHVRKVEGQRRATRNGGTAQVWEAVGAASEVAA